MPQDYNETIRNFEQTDSAIDIDVIAEIMNRANIDSATQDAFFQQAAVKVYHSISGEVSNIKTNKDGSTVVSVQSGATTNYFYSPTDYTDAQLEEFKRAQNHGLCVTVKFQTEPGSRPINSVSVHKCH
jgi:hypothetical protein